MQSRHIIPRLADFLDRNPELSLQIDVSERYVSLIEEGVDLAVRIGDVADSSLSTRQIGSVTAMIVAAPAYLQRRGVPATPEALEEHSAVQFLYHGQVRPWEFHRDKERIEVSPPARVQTNDADGVHAAAVAGLGLARGPSWMFIEQLASGALVPILEDYTPRSYPIWAVTARSRQKARTVEAIVDFLAGLFAAEPELRVR